MENFNILYGSIVRFKDKIPLFSYYVVLENNLKEALIQALNYFFQITCVGAYPGGKEVFQFDNGIIYSIYNNNLTLIYVVITKREDISNQRVFLFIKDCMDALEDEIDFPNLEKLAKNKYSRTFLSIYEQLIQKHNADSSNTFERLDRKVVRVLSTINRGINVSLKNKENLNKLQRRLSSLFINAKMFQDKTHAIRKSVHQKWHKILLCIILFILTIAVVNIFILSRR